MSDIIKAIHSVAKFAESTHNNEAYTYLVFDNDKIYAQGDAGGVCQHIDVGFSCAVRASILLRAVKAIGDSEATLSYKNNKLLIKSKTSKADIGAFPFKDALKLYSPPKDATWTEVTGLDCVSKSFFPTDERHREISFGKTHATSVNGHCLASHHCELGDVVGDQDAIFISPETVRDIPSTCWVCRDSKFLFISMDKDNSLYRFLRLRDVTFPVIEPILERAKNQPEIVFQRKEFVDAMKRARNSGDHAVISVEDGKASISTTDQTTKNNLFHFVSEIPAEPSPEFGEGKIGLNLNYLLPAVSTTTSDAISVRFTPDKDGSLEPLLVEDGDYSAVIMPMRL